MENEEDILRAMVDEVFSGKSFITNDEYQDKWVHEELTPEDRARIEKNIEINWSKIVFNISEKDNKLSTFLRDKYLITLDVEDNSVIIAFNSNEDLFNIYSENMEKLELISEEIENVTSLQHHIELGFIDEEWLENENDADIESNWKKIMSDIDNENKYLGKMLKKSYFGGINKIKNDILTVIFVFDKVSQKMCKQLDEILHDEEYVQIIVDAIYKYSDKGYGIQFVKTIGGIEEDGKKKSMG